MRTMTRIWRRCLGSLRSGPWAMAAGLPCGLLAVALFTHLALAKGNGGQDAEDDLSIQRALSPTAEPIPALRYRLLPRETDRVAGDAAPIYLRLAHEKLDGWRREMTEKCSEWFVAPGDEFDAEADVIREYLANNAYDIRQIELAARRASCEWNYMIREQDPFMVRLPELAQMRNYARLTAVKARLEARTGRFDEAVHTLQTGLAMAQHVAQTPILVNRLVGIAMARLMLDVAEELISQPGAPNLYWALTALPSPFIEVAPALDFEATALELKFPELARLDELATAEQWSELLGMLLNWLAEINGLDGELDSKLPKTPAELISLGDLDGARRYLVGVEGRPADEVAAMSEAEVIVRHSYGLHRELADETFKWSYVDYPQAIAGVMATDKHIAQRMKEQLLPFSQLLLPSVSAVYRAHATLDRRIALLRTLEAIRGYAAAHDGRLPETLEEITAVPVPLDPMSGAEFKYSRDGDAAHLETPATPMDEVYTSAIERRRIALRAPNDD